MENHLLSIPEMGGDVKEEAIQSYHKHLGYSLVRDNLAEFSLYIEPRW